MRRGQKPKAPVGLAWEAVKRGDPFRYRLKRLLIAGKYGDLRLALTRVVQCAGSVSYTHLTLPTNREV